ncbi:MAG TPA: type II secretion system protein [Solirubrobacterales bacterium]|nr:type II secretion system protein [Solirubrobacterales bacterium]
MKARFSGQEGFTIVEVLVAIFIVSIAAMVTFSLMTTATRNAQRAKANQVAIEFAEQELERLRSEPDENLAMTGIPGPSTNSNSPNYRIRTDEFALKRQPLGEYGELVRVGGKLEGKGTNEEGTNLITQGDVAPVENFESGDVTGKVYRYVVWRNDAACGASCPTQQDYKQIVVAVQVNSTASDPYQHGYFEVQSKFINPKKNSESDPVKNKEGNYVTAQQFFLTDTPCAASGETQRVEPTEEHPLHNTLGTCANGPKTGSSEVGAPDALSLYPPSDPAPEDPEVPSLFDYANDFYLEPSPDTDKGLQIPRSTTTGCNSFKPPSVEHPESLVHRWVTDQMPQNFILSGKVTFEFYSRTINNGQYSGGLCIYLFKREESKEPELLSDLVGATKYWLYAPPGYWPLSEAQAPREWKRVRLTMQLSGLPITIPKNARFGLGLSVDPAHTNADAIPIMYDFPTMASRLEVDTTTPLEG